MTKAPRPQVVMIVGMHRSGTSAVGRLLEGLGFDFGSNLMEGITNINDKGFWEDKEVVALNEHIFEILQSSWFDFERLPGKWWEEDRIKELVGIAETWFDESFAGDRPVAFKDPRLCRLLPFWKRVFLGRDIEPHVLFVIRHPAEVAASLKERDSFSLQVGYLLWLTYVIDALYYSRNLELTILDYDDLIQHPENRIKQLVKADLVSISGLYTEKISEIAQQTLEPDSKHQHVHDVLSQGEVQGDVQALAHELYDVLRNSTVDEAKSVADKYRKRQYRLLDHHKEVLLALKAAVARQVEINHQLFEVGSGHSQALSVIHDKDKQLEENKTFIEKCLAEIGSKESQLALTRQELERNQARIVEQEALLQKNTALWDKFEELQQVIHGNELELSESLAYIEKCEAWIGELNLISEDYQRLLGEQREYVGRCEARIREQDQWLSENADYIAKCEARIKEQDAGLAENRDYIQRCEARVREQDHGMHIRDQMLGERLDRIHQLEASVRELQATVEKQQGEFDNATRVTRERNAWLEQRIQDIEAELKATQLTLDEKLTYLKQCEVYIAEQDQALEEQGKQINDFGNTLARLTQQLADEATQYSAGLQERQQVIAERDNALLARQQEVADCRDEIAQLDAELHRQVQAHNEQQALASTLTHEVAKLQQVLQAREQDLKLKNQRIQSQDKQLDDLRAELARIQSQLATQENCNRGLEVDLQQRATTLIERDKTIRELELTRTTLQQQLALAHAAVEDKTNMLQIVDSQREQLEKALAALNADLAERTVSIVNLQQDVERLQQLDNLSKQRAAMQKKQIDTLRSHVAALESEEVALKAQLEARQQELQRYRSYRVVKLIDKFTEVE